MSRKTPEENENECLRFIEGSFRLLEQARRAALMNSSPQQHQASDSPSPTMSSVEVTPTLVSHTLSSAPQRQDNEALSTWSTDAAAEFNKNFPGLCRPISGRQLQTYLPNARKSSASGSNTPYSRPATKPWTGRVLNTWTHDFVCLASTNSFLTPSGAQLESLRKAGLGKKKVVFKNKNGDHIHLKETLEIYFPRLQTQHGAFKLSRAASGGSGIRDLSPLQCSVKGYSIQELKTEVRASTIYIVPLNTDIDVTPVTINDLTTEKPILDGVLSKCSSCQKDIPLWEFQEHKNSCKNLKEESSSTSHAVDEKPSIYPRVKAIFPDIPDSILRRVCDVSIDLEDAVDQLLSTNQNNISDGSNTSNTSAGNSSDHKTSTNYSSLDYMLVQYRRNLSSEVYSLVVERDEIWRQGVTFYKKAIKNPGLIFKTLEVQFTKSTGEEKSTDAGAIKIEFFEILLQEFVKRAFIGEIPNLVPRLGDSINFLLFGIAIGHSLLNGGPGLYMLQPWVYSVIAGKHNPDHLLEIISKDDIPVNAATAGIIEFLNKIDAAATQEELDMVVDENIQILNCSRWDPCKAVTISTKFQLLSELIMDHLVRKRRSQISSIREGLAMTKLLPFIEQNHKLCSKIFVATGEEISPEEFFKNFEDKVEDLDYEKQQALKFFKEFVNSSLKEIILKVLRFATGYTSIPPWGLPKKISIKYLEDTDEKMMPEAMVCFNILYLPTIHSTQTNFNHYFIKAIEFEGVGFSAPF